MATPIPNINKKSRFQSDRKHHICMGKGKNNSNVVDHTPETFIDISSVVTTSVSHDDQKPQSKSKSSSEAVFNILTGFHAGYFRITLSLSAQALLWKTLSSSSSSSSSSISSTSFLNSVQQLQLPHISHLLLWLISAVTLAALSVLYLLRCLFRFRSVRSEFADHVGVNYLFAPWISCLLLLQSSPASLLLLNPEYSSSYRVLWWMFTVPIVALEVKIYGQWFTKGKRFLSMVANPTNQISVIANMACARAAAEMGCKEMALCLFSFGITHYLVLFVTLYQRFADRIPSALRPVFFLFFATPGFASLAWSSICGSFDVASKMLFFVSLFLFASLVSRPLLFLKSMRKFNVAWWAYSFPLTMQALASIKYAQEVKTHFANCQMLVLTVISVLAALILMVVSVFNITKILPYDDPFLSSCIVASQGTSPDFVDMITGQRGRNRGCHCDCRSDNGNIQQSIVP